MQIVEIAGLIIPGEHSSLIEKRSSTLDTGIRGPPGLMGHPQLPSAPLHNIWPTTTDLMNVRVHVKCHLLLPGHLSDDKVHVQDLLYGKLLLMTSAVDQR